MPESTENLGISQAGFHQTVDILSVKHHSVYGIPFFRCFDEWIWCESQALVLGSNLKHPHSLCTMARGIERQGNIVP